MQKNQQTKSTTEDDQRTKADSFNWLTAADTKTWLDERDACALVAAIRKNGEATHGNLKRALAALSIMGHRSGEVNGEGDGVGVLTDIPRLLWSQALEQEASLAGSQRIAASLSGI